MTNNNDNDHEILEEEEGITGALYRFEYGLAGLFSQKEKMHRKIQEGIILMFIETTEKCLKDPDGRHRHWRYRHKFLDLNGEVLYYYNLYPHDKKLPTPCTRI